MSVSREEAIHKRDRKVKASMSGMAPVWLVHDEFRPHEDSLLFNVVFVNPEYGWVNHRLKYDAFNDVLYHMGEKRISEAEALPIQEKEPYIPGEVASRVPFEPSYRPSPPLEPGAKG